MRHSLNVALLTTLTLAPVAAKAAPVTFDLNGMTTTSQFPFTAGPSVTGSFVIDTGTGLASQGNYVFNVGGTDYTFDLENQASFQSHYFTLFQDIPDQISLSIEYPSATLIGYTGGGVCTTAVCDGATSTLNIGPGNSNVYFLTSSSTITPEITATPEPSSLLLFATGALGIAGAARRRLHRR